MLKTTLKIAMVLSVFAWLIWLFTDKPQPPVKEYVKVPEIREVLKYRTVKGPTEIQIVEKETIKEVPVYIKEDVNKQVTATGVISPYAGQTNVLAIMDTATGKSEIQARQLPLPWAEFRFDREAGIRYGISSKGQGMDIYGRVTVARVEKAFLGAYVEINNTPDAKVMLDLSYRW